MRINVNRVYLPPKERYLEYIDRIYESGWITNNGELLRELEDKLCEYLNVKNVVLLSNGTSALEIAYRVLDINRAVITTPFSFVATTSSLVANNITPIFCDIDPNTLCIDSSKIEQVITEDTQAIVATHIFGNICNIEEIEKIAKRYSLKVIYDAAHTFGVKYRDRSAVSYGDISVLSFHATKIFHTIEGGAIVTDDDELAKKARYIRNFGIENEETIPYLGINAKMNEFEAAMGLAILSDIDKIIKSRREIYQVYEKELREFVKFPHYSNKISKNYGYFPIIFNSEDELLRVKDALNRENIFPRRYFYPSLDTLNYIKHRQYMPISRDISKRVLVLPMYVGLSKREQSKIVHLIQNSLKI